MKTETPVTTHPIRIIEAGEGYAESIAVLDREAADITEAKALATAAGYSVIDLGEGGACELHAPDGGETPEWYITVLPPTATI